MIKAIETHYKGYRFRSRLEARWAVFFETLGYDWKYEAQGFQHHGEKYLPDFEIKSNNLTFYIEVKGSNEQLQKDAPRYSTALDWGGCLPDFEESSDHQRTGLVLLGDIPEPKFGTWFHPIIRHSKGLHLTYITFTSTGPFPVLSAGVLPYLCDLSGEQCIEGDFDKWTNKARFLATPFAYSKISEAYKTARSARFEHGERP